MSLRQIVARSLRQHLVSTLICAFSIALAGGLLLTVWVTQQQTKRAFTGLDGGYDAVLGARGSKLQLVLNAVFHLEESPGNLKVEDWQEIQKHPAVARAIPLAMGDSFQGHRIVGTSVEYFEATQSAAGQKLKSVSGGRLFDPTAREAVVGNLVARKLGLAPGSIIHPTHGLGREGQQHEEEYVVVGILEASNTPADRVIWIPLEGIQLMSGHSAEAEHELSAVLVKLKADSPTAGFLLDGKYNREGTRLTWAWPIGRVMAQLFDKVGWFDLVLRLVAWLVVLVSIASVTAGIYNSMEERRRDVATLRPGGDAPSLESLPRGRGSDSQLSSVAPADPFEDRHLRLVRYVNAMSLNRSTQLPHRLYLWIKIPMMVIVAVMAFQSWRINSLRATEQAASGQTPAIKGKPIRSRAATNTDPNVVQVGLVKADAAAVPAQPIAAGVPGFAPVTGSPNCC